MTDPKLPQQPELGSNRIPVLAAAITAAHATARPAARTSIEKAVEAGKLLIEAKAALSHGNWRGRVDAKAKGVKFGRKPIVTPHQQREAIRRRDVDGETLRSIGRSYNVSQSTISRLTD